MESLCGSTARATMGHPCGTPSLRERGRGEGLGDLGSSLLARWPPEEVDSEGGGIWLRQDCGERKAYLMQTLGDLDHKLVPGCTETPKGPSPLSRSPAFKSETALVGGGGTGNDETGNDERCIQN